jgi:hypothetical protein
LHINEHQGSLRGTPVRETPLTEYLVCAAVGDEPVRISCPVSFAVVRPPERLTYPATETLVDVSVPEASRSDTPPSERHSRTTTRLAAPRARRAAYRSLALASLHQGSADRFLVEPALPCGMTLHEHTGEIRGAPTIGENRSYRGVHTVIAENCMGTTSCKVHVDISCGAWNLVMVHVSSAVDTSPARRSSPTKQGLGPLRVAGADALGGAAFDARPQGQLLARSDRVERESGMRELTAMLLCDQSCAGFGRHDSGRFPVCVPG